MARQVSRLGIGNYLKLAEWWKENHQTLLQKKMTYEDSSTIASKSLSIPVTKHHCETIAEELNLFLCTRVSGLTKDEILTRLEKVEALVEHLYTKLGEAKPS